MPRKHRYTEHQMIEALKEIEAGTERAEICRRMGVDNRTLYKWQTKFAGMAMSDVHRLRHLEKENAQLKKMLAEAELDKQMLRSVISKK